ncbi:MAG: hypothetical protein AAF585_21600 [Verrucomicrobiota bacterium]
MELIGVCGQFELSDFDSCGVTHLISIGDSDDDFGFIRFAADDHLCLRFTDTSDPTHDDAPTAASLKPLLQWAERVGDGQALIHCAGGISRSPAVALLALCATDPDTNPQNHMESVTAVAKLSYIWPNELVIEIGDDLLNRNGEIVAGVDRWRAEQGSIPNPFFDGRNSE